MPTSWQFWLFIYFEKPPFLFFLFIASLFSSYTYLYSFFLSIASLFSSYITLPSIYRSIPCCNSHFSCGEETSSLFSLLSLSSSFRVCFSGRKKIQALLWSNEGCGLILWSCGWCWGSYGVFSFSIEGYVKALQVFERWDFSSNSSHQESHGRKRSGCTRHD